MIYLETHIPYSARPDYKELGLFKNQAKFKNVPLLALTATATPRVQEDVRRQLRMTKCVTFTMSFNRSNLRCDACTCVDVDAVFLHLFNESASWAILARCL